MVGGEFLGASVSCRRCVGVAEEYVFRVQDARKAGGEARGGGASGVCRVTVCGHHVRVQCWYDGTAALDSCCIVCVVTDEE